MRISKVLFFVALLIFLVSASTLTAKEDESRQDILYSCDCGSQCNCNSVSTKPGDCKCGKPMKWGHVLKIEGNEALVCTCEKGCKCSLDPKDPTKCGCGKPVKRVNLKGTGIYFCNCGGSCTCNTVSDKPGKCKCKMDLKRVD
jgi:hypothetical protein